MLAYLFWHRPLQPHAVDAYERAELCFQRSLSHTPPAGFAASAAFRIERLPWAEAPPSGPAYEDWYLVEDYAALGVLREAAVARGHRSRHDELARRSTDGAGGLYALLEGDRGQLPRSVAQATLAVWVAGPGRAGLPGSRRLNAGAVAELLGDGMDPRRASVWRRELVLGPAPEFCVLGSEAPPGVAPSRLPAGWTATALERRPLS